ncbi:MAG: GntR family transcriptional regulator [Pseudomonadota bacterium]
MSTTTKVTESAAGASETLTSRAYALMRTDIIKGRLKPAAKLKIEELREFYGIGASPIREALSLLSSDGLVERIDQRGFRVANISRDEFTDILRVRCWLEERALRESIQYGDAGWEEELVLVGYRIDKEPRSTGSGKRFVANEAWEVLHKRLHMSLISACRSPILLAYCDQLYDKNVRYRNLSVQTASKARDVGPEHASIIEAALARDAETAVKRLIAHYQRTGSILTVALA